MYVMCVMQHGLGVTLATNASRAKLLKKVFSYSNQITLQMRDFFYTPIERDNWCVGLISATYPSQSRLTVHHRNDPQIEEENIYSNERNGEEDGTKMTRAKQTGPKIMACDTLPSTTRYYFEEKKKLLWRKDKLGRVRERRCVFHKLSIFKRTFNGLFIRQHFNQKKFHLCRHFNCKLSCFSKNNNKKRQTVRSCHDKYWLRLIFLEWAQRNCTLEFIQNPEKLLEFIFFLFENLSRFSNLLYS